MAERDAGRPRATFAERLALILAFLMALIPLGHKLPAFGPLPRIGPFEAEPLRGSVLALCILICVVKASFGNRAHGTMRPLGYLLDAAIVAVGAWACWRFYVDVTAMHTSIVFFEPLQAWTSLAGCFVILLMTWRIWGGSLAVVAGIALVWFLWSFRGDFLQATT